MKGDPKFDKLNDEEKRRVAAFLAVAVGFTAHEVARVVTNLSSGINYMGCGKSHIALSYGRDHHGIGENPALMRLDLEKFKVLLQAERERLVSYRARKARREEESQQRRKKQADHQARRALAADRWEALEEYGLVQVLVASGRPITLADLTELADEKLLA